MKPKVIENVIKDKGRTDETVICIPYSLCSNEV